ncbi:MAG: IMP dehydrogenase [Bacteriovoracaceae bacterium]|jgi:IMP dehydrogenase|nr:IMP dehydrogenase [Bacteriovoracaceae bacterium]
MLSEKEISLAYDDVLISPNYSEVLPHETCLKTRFSKNIYLNIPLVSSAMDTVTESKTAIVMAQNGGIGVIHKNLSIKDQVKEVTRVKKYVAGVIDDPICIDVDTTYEQIIQLTQKYTFCGFPVLENKKLVGIITNRDLRYETDITKLAKELMTSKEKLITANKGISIEQAKEILKENKVEKLPLVDGEQLAGLITIKDIDKSIKYPHANVDKHGRLRVAAAIGVGDKEFDRAKSLIEEDVDAIVIDTAHGHSKGVIEMIKKVKNLSEDIDVIAGNVATKEACEDLINAGADGIKIGIGPGSICTTRVVAGIGVPQFQALVDCKEVCLKKNIPFIADGGIKLSGDIVKALAVGASSVMIGSLFAGTDEAPGQRVIYQGRAYKVYRGMGSLGAMELGSKDRYGQGSIQDNKKLVPEGIEGQIAYRGSLSENIHQLVGGIRAGLGYTGSKNLNELMKKARFVRISGAGLKESHPHDVLVTKEAPNYRG